MTESSTSEIIAGATVIDAPEGRRSPAIGKAPTKPYLIGVLYYGGIDREHDRCIQSLKGHPYVKALFEMTGCPYIDIGRSIIATKVLDTPEVGGLLFFDHDMIFDVEEVEKLIEATEACEGVVGAAYSMRRPGHMIGGLDTTKLGEGEKVVFFEGGQPRPASYLGMGMTAIHRSVFERLVARADEKQRERHAVLADLERLGSLHPDAKALASRVKAALRDHELPRSKSGISDADVVPFFSHLQLKDIYYGEDVSFCLRCHDANVPVQIDTRVRVYHKGTYCYGLEDCGMVVPYCARLETLCAPENVIQNTPYHVPQVEKALDAHPEVRATLEAQRKEGIGDRGSGVGQNGEQSFPKSEDPLSFSPHLAGPRTPDPGPPAESARHP